MRNIKVVLSQCGAALELHNVADNPVTLILLSPTRLEWYRDQMSESNPDMRYATIGQVAMYAAQRLVQSITDLDPNPYVYNASTDTYSRA
jgi:hypothetical protein